VLVALFVATVLATVLGLGSYPHWSRAYGHEIAFNRAMFSRDVAQPISFSHRLHVTDKQIDCRYCHSTPDRSLNAGMPTASKCLGCHDHIIVQHQEIAKLKDYLRRGQEFPWVRVYYAPQHVFFPHYRHLGRGVACQECHGEVERVDRLHKVTFYMGFCLDCHTKRGAPRTCTACHQ
jgi:hypothetical protein